jgi:hypothetical protein
MNDLEAQLGKRLEDHVADLVKRLERIADALEADLGPTPRPNLVVVEAEEDDDA